MLNTDKHIASEALYAFIGWLTSRNERSVLSSKDDAAPIAELVQHFILVQGYQQPREEYAKPVVMFEHPVQKRRPLEQITEDQFEEFCAVHFIDSDEVKYSDFKMLGVEEGKLNLEFTLHHAGKVYRIHEEINLDGFNYLLGEGFRI